MGDAASLFPVGARVRIGGCEGTVKRVDERVVVQFDGVGFPGYFDPKFVHLVSSSSDAPNQTAPEPVVDSELRDQVAQALHYAQCSGSDTDAWDCGNPVHWQDWRELADRAVDPVAPVLAAKEQKYDDSLQTMKNECDQAVAEATVEIDAADANLREIRLQLAEMVDASEGTPIPDLLGKVKVELDLRWATRQQYAEERDAALVELQRERESRQGWQEKLAEMESQVCGELRIEEDNVEWAERALHLVLGCCTLATQEECTGRVREVYDAIRAGQPLPYSVGTLAAKLRNRNREYGRASATIGRLRAELARERQRTANLLTEVKSWIGRTIRADGEAARARDERDELRAHGVARDIGEANEQMRAELVTLSGEADKWHRCASRLRLALDASLGGPRQYAWDLHPDVKPDGRPDTEATEQAEPRKPWPSPMWHEQPCKTCGCDACDHDPTAEPVTPTEPRVWRKGDPEVVDGAPAEDKP